MTIQSRSRLGRRAVLAGLGAILATHAAPQPAGPRRPLFGGPGAAKFPRVDVHMHLIGARQQFGDAVEACAGKIQEFGIAKAVVMSPPQPPPGFFDAPQFAPELRRHGDWFAFLGGGGTLNPMLHAYGDVDSVTPDVMQRFVDVANRLLDDGAIGFGEIAVLHLSLVNRHPFEQVASTHPLLKALAEVADQRKVVIDLHMDPVVMAAMHTPAALHVPPNPPTLASNVDGFEQLVAEHPGARFVWAHGGSDLTGNFTPALIGKMMDAHPNLFMSLRPLPPQGAANNPFGLRFYNLILTTSGIASDWLALLRKHSDRFVMGSDSFFLSASADPEAAPALLGRGNQARLTAGSTMLSLLPAELAAKVATENARRIYRI